MKANNVFLIVDDDEIFRRRLRLSLEDRGYKVLDAASVDDARAILQKNKPQKAIVDLNMPGESGLVLVQELCAKQPSTEVIVLTGYGSITTAIQAVRLGARDYISKPADTDQILAAFQTKQSPATPGDKEFDPPSLARLEWEHIQRVLKDCAGNISEAARRLGIHRRSLQRKLQKMPPHK